MESSASTLAGAGDGVSLSDRRSFCSCCGSTRFAEEVASLMARPCRVENRRDLDALIRQFLVVLFWLFAFTVVYPVVLVQVALSGRTRYCEGFLRGRGS